MAITTFQIATQPTNGILSGLDTNVGSILYTPTTNFVGIDTFTYNILCDNIVVDTATVNITVVLTSCIKNIVVDSECTGLLNCSIRLASSPGETNRVVSISGKNIKFTCESGTNDYILKLADSSAYTLSNQSC